MKYIVQTLILISSETENSSPDLSKSGDEDGTCLQFTKNSRLNTNFRYSVVTVNIPARGDTYKFTRTSHENRHLQKFVCHVTFPAYGYTGAYTANSKKKTHLQKGVTFVFLSNT